MIDRVSRTLTAVFIAAGVVAIPSAVRAQQRVEGESRETKSTTQQGTQQGTNVVDEEQYNTEDELGRKRPKREPLYLGLDVTLGFGNYAVAMELNPQPPNF